MSLVSVVIVHFTKPAQTLAAVEALVRSTQIPLEIIVVDNGADGGEPLGNAERETWNMKRGTGLER